MTPQVPRVAIIGLGGFAHAHHRALHALEEAGECRVVGACDPAPDDFGTVTEGLKFRERDITPCTDYLEMLAAHGAGLDLVTVPTPIPLHAPMHRAAVERGVACYLEKPPTLYYVELDEMLEVEARARKQTQVGFNFIVETTRQRMKERILAGEFGRVRRAGFIGYWPRATTYFTRAAWAARLLLNGRLVLDSCVGNALAHYIHNLHFWCGQDGLLSWEEVAEAEVELYRAHAIENFDTCFVRGTCANGIEFHVAATHACAGSQYQREWIECERATITYIVGDVCHIDWPDGRRETEEADRRDLIDNFRAYFQYLRGEVPRPLTRLIDSRPFVHFNNLIYVAAKAITTVPEEHIARTPTANQEGELVAIRGIREVMETFAAQGHFPSEQSVAWSKPGGRASADEIPRLLSVVQAISDERAEETHGKAP